MKTLVTFNFATLALFCVTLAPAQVSAQCVPLTPSEWQQLNVLEGRAYWAIVEKRFRTGIRLAGPLLKLSRKGCEKRPELSALAHLADGYFGLRDYKRALAFYEFSLRLAKETNNLVHETFSLYRMSLCYLKLHDLSRAQNFRHQLADVIPKIETSEPSYNRGYADIIRLYLKEIDVALKRRSSTNGAI